MATVTLAQLCQRHFQFVVKKRPRLESRLHELSNEQLCDRKQCGALVGAVKFGWEFSVEIYNYGC